MKRILPFITVSLMVIAIIGCSKTKTEEVTVRFGTLPVLQSLELFVAQDLGLFEKAGVKVELIPFNTAAEKDIAITSGQIDGYFGDLFTPVVIEGNGKDISIVATNYNTKDDRRMFAILSKPGSDKTVASSLKEVPVAISSNSVIHFLTENLLASQGLNLDEMAFLESKNIGLRMQMLMSGKIEAATLPEPLVSAAIAGGATLIRDDKGIDLSQTVLMFDQSFLTKNAVSVKSFLAAVNEAASLINEHPESVREVMVKYVRLPEPMKQTFPVPTFPALTVPSDMEIATTFSWLKEKGVLQRDLSYADVVNGRYLK